MDDEAIEESLHDWRKKRNWNKPTNVEQLTREFIENLLKTPDDDLVPKFLDCVYGLLDANDKWNDQFEYVKTLPVGFIFLYAVTGVEAEINNGGYNQYYFNSAGEFAEVAVCAFEAIGSPELAKLQRKANETALHEANKLSEYWAENTIEKFMESYAEKIFDDLDSRFYEKSADLNGLQINYIRNNFECFVFE